MVTELGARCSDTEASLSSTGEEFCQALCFYGVQNCRIFLICFVIGEYHGSLSFQVSGHRESLRRRGLPRRVDEEETTGRRPR